MKKIEEIYYYVFYTYYRFGELAPLKWWSDWKTVITIDYLEILFFATFWNLIRRFIEINTSFDYFSIIGFCIGVVIVLGNNIIFFRNNKWKKEILRYKEMNKRKDIFGIILTVIISVVIVVSYYLT